MKDRVCKKSSLGMIMFVTLLIILPACDGAKEKSDKDETTGQIAGGESVADGSPILVKLDGEAIITLDGFQKEFDDFVDKNRLRPLIAFMPDAKDKFLDGLISQHVIDREIQTKGIDQKEQYQQEMTQIIKSARQMLNTKYFAELHPVQITETEMKQFYEENKEKLPDILVSRGGVNAIGIKFDKDSDAQSFFEKVKNKPSSFAQEAKLAKVDGRIENFELVTDQTTGIEPIVREKIVSFERFPKIEMVKIDDNACWVVYAKEKKAAECRPFEEVKATVEQYVMREKRMQVLEQEINKLREKYDIVVDKSAFGNDQQSGMPQMPMMPQEEGNSAPKAPATQAV